MLPYLTLFVLLNSALSSNVSIEMDVFQPAILFHLPKLDRCLPQQMTTALSIRAPLVKRPFSAGKQCIVMDNSTVVHSDEPTEVWHIGKETPFFLIFLIAAMELALMSGIALIVLDEIEAQAENTIWMEYLADVIEEPENTTWMDYLCDVKEEPSEKEDDDQWEDMMERVEQRVTNVIDLIADMKSAMARESDC